MERSRALGRATAGLLALAALAGCAPALQPQPAVTVTLVPRENRALPPTPPPDPKPAVVWPLTGLDATQASEQDMARPALSIKIENSNSARPQTNLDRADVVYETMIDYGISRLIAVYHSDYPETVGPIRSLRPHDENIAAPLGGPIVFSGAQRRFITAAQSHGVDLIAQDIGDVGFFRVTTNYAPHNLHGELAEFHRQAKSKEAPEEQWRVAYPAEDSTAGLLGKPTKGVDIALSPYAKPSWDWSESQGAWLRNEGSQPHVTLAGKRITADNIVILRVQVRYTSRVPGGIAVPETLVNNKSGKGFVMADGKYVEIRWKKGGRTAPFVLTTAEGYPVYLKPGRTWFELVPSKGAGDTQYVRFD